MQRRLLLTTSALVLSLEAVLSPPRLLATVQAAESSLHGGLAANGSPADTAAVSLLTAAVGTAAWLCVAWLAVLCALDALSGAPGRLGDVAGRVRSVLTPRLIARLLYSGVAAGSALGIATPALAAASTPTAATAATSLAAPCAQNPLPDLDRPVPPTACAPAVTSATARTATVQPSAVGAPYIVRAGDTLWSVAAAELSATTHLRPTSTAIAARWPAWWQANRDEIGGDPALLLPGEQLSAPSTAP